MWKISRLCLLCLCAGILALAGCSRSETADAAKAKAEAEAAKAEVAQVNSELAAAKAEVAQVNSELAQVKSELTQVKGELVKLWAAVKDKPFTLDLVKAKLVATKTTFPLDLDGLTAADYKKALSEPDLGKLPPAPKVAMALELTNTSDVEVEIGGPTDVLVLELKGPGAVSVTPRQAREQEPGKRQPLVPRPALLAPVSLAPGKSLSLPISSLTYRRNGITTLAYWTEPGDYTLSASLMTAVKPSPKGVKPDEEGFGKVTLTSEPLRIKVEKKE